MRTDLAVIGAGPAGLAAALAASARGVRVTLLDAATQPGGQFYRQPGAGLGAARPEALHHGWRTWERLRDGLAASAVRVLTDHHVWCVERTPDGFTVHALLGPEQEEPVEVHARAVLLATGGYEQVLPFPGWTLPGVVSAGGAQAMLKGGLVVPGRRAVVAGTGPLLLPVATGLAAAGVEVAALVESTAPLRLARQAPALAGKLAEGVGHAAGLLRHRVPVLTRHTVVRAHGEDRLTGVTVAALDADGHVRPGTERHLPCDTLAAGHGMLPHTDLAESLGCRLDGLAVDVDTEQRTDVPGVWAAGEATGIGGAALSLAEGHIAGCSATAHLHGTARGPAPAALKARTALRRSAAALDSAYALPAYWSEQLTDDTVVCRCEEVTAGSVREALDLGAGDERTVKLLTRAGMGWCQGRMCSTAVAGLAGCAPTPAKRPFARPVPLGVLARHHPQEGLS
ncbi:NAD(P)/FAD-dependent oxidoreductase [Streptomyces iakyrus]|uniref:FAD/NAD(P)-dependent oxidoreductase n=1 Tax=Streptomyces iakyrus TaxID=68219 RepID=UPI000525A7A2|nr:NAD(P)/FAD-dependent oxidoreductase [Streptomyces iakyrus]